MTKTFGQLIALIVAASEQNAKRLLLMFALLGTLAAWYSVMHFSIDSDTAKLIRPSKDISWYAGDQRFKRVFPQYLNTSLIVISSTSAAAAHRAGETAYKAFTQSQRFTEVFAPIYDPFFVEHALYSLPLQRINNIREQVESNLDSLSFIHLQPTVERYAQQLAASVRLDSANGELSELSRTQLTSLLASLDAINNRETNIPSLRRVSGFQPNKSSDLYFQIITLKAEQEFSSELPNAKIVADIETIIGGLTLPSDVQVRISGEVPMANDEISAALNGIEIAGLISIILLAIILGIGIRSVRAISGIFVMLIVGVVLTSAFAGLTVGQYNTLSMIFLIMFFGLGVDFAVHYIMRVKEISAHPPSESDQTKSAAVLAINDIGQALALCTITSAIAFLAFLPTAYVGLAELGIISAGGMLIAFTLCITLLPAWFSLFPLEATPSYQPKSLYKSHKLSAKPVLLITLVLLTMATWKAVDLRFDYSVLGMRDQNTQAMQALLDLQKHQQFTDYSISVILPSGTNEAELIAKLNQLPEVASVATPDDLLAKRQNEKHALMRPLGEQLQQLGETTRATTIPPTDAFSFAYLQGLLTAPPSNLTQDEELFGDLKIALNKLLENSSTWPLLQNAVARGVDADLEQLITWFNAKPYSLEQLPTGLRARLIGSDNQRLIHVHPAVSMLERSDATRFINSVTELVPNTAGRAVVEWGIGAVTVEAFEQAVTLASLLIIILLVAYFRSLGLAVLVLIPILLTTVFTFALLVLAGGSLNMANILVVPLILGLGVDTGIHVVHRYMQSHSTRSLMRSSTSRAVTISGLTTIATFLSLSLSPHKGAASIGMLLAVAISLMLLTTFIVLPALLELFTGRQAATSET